MNLFMKKQVAAALAILLILAGCTQGGEGSGASQPQASTEETSGDIQPPDGPPSAPADLETSGEGSEAEESEPEPEPLLDRMEITMEEASQLLVPVAGVLKITTPKQLVALAALVNSGADSMQGVTVLLGDGLSLAGFDFEPIGTMAYPFHGSFDGGGHIITGLTVLRGEIAAGLFGCITEESKLENIHVTNGRVIGGEMVGGIVGCAKGTVSACSYRGSVTGTGAAVGGVCGYLGSPGAETSSAVITQSAGNAQVEGHVRVGGLCGETAAGSLVNDCYALGSVTAVSGNEEAGRIGGLIGRVGGSVMRCFTSTEVYTRVNSRIVGGFIGLNEGEVFSCYYNVKPSENWKAVGYAEEEDSYEVTGCTVEEITEAATFEGWDFAGVWDIAADKNRGLPFLRAVMG